MTRAPSLRLATAGIGAVGTAFGMARYGYGLLLPDIQHDYGLNPGMLGAIGASAYGAYLVATAVAGKWARRLGPRRTVVIGGLSAAIGMLTAGLSHGAAVLIIGVLIGGASCGLILPPFSDAVAGLPASVRGRTLSAINCGTGYGVALAAPLAILVGDDWRAAWLVFAACALLTTLWAGRVLPRHVPTGSSQRTARTACDSRDRPTPRLARAAWPLISGALLVGVGSAAYWTFAVDDLQRAGGLSPTASSAFLGVVGVASLISTATGDLIARVGARPVFVAAVSLEAASVALLATAPSSLIAAFTSAIVFGACFNAVIAIEALWSLHLYPQRPSFGLAVAMAATGVGQLCGPLASGTLANRIGLTNVLFAGAGIIALASLTAPRSMTHIAGSPAPRIPPSPVQSPAVETS